MEELRQQALAKMLEEMAAQHGGAEDVKAAADKWLEQVTKKKLKQVS